MVPNSPVEALGSHGPALRDLIIEVVRARHALAAEAHQVSRSRYEMGFGSQWRDLLDDTHDRVTERGFQSYKLAPGGRKIPVVNDCLVYVWRVPDDADAVSKFAASPTRQAGFVAPPPPPMLFEPTLTDEAEPAEVTPEADEIASVMAAVGGTMPLVLVMVRSSPRQLQSIEWAVAVLGDSGEVQVRGQECIWEPELIADEAASDVESFDAGTPVQPVVEPQAQDRPQPGA
jgi:hypothetical protein